MIQPLHIIIDSREQSPWAWEPSDATVEIAGLACGDYSLASDTEVPKRKGQLRPVRFSIERKSLDDFIGTISTGWDRFQRELTRMENFPARVVIVEGDFEDVCFSERGGEIIPPPHNHPNMRPTFVARRIAELTMQGVSVILAGNADMASGMAYRIFRRRLEVAMGTEAINQ
jgi:ERCC4-type nuclease